MTSLPPNTDELVSSYLDGEAAPEEIALVEASPELLARVDELRGLRDLLTAPLSAPSETKQAHIAAALDVFDELFAADSPQDSQERFPSESRAGLAPTQAPSTPPVVSSFDQARERRRFRRSSGLIAAAAAVLLLFAGVAVLNSGQSRNQANVATSVTDTRSSGAMAEAASAQQDSASDAASDAATSQLAPAVEAADDGDESEQAAAEPETERATSTDETTEAAPDATSVPPIAEEDSAAADSGEAGGMADNESALESTVASEFMLGEFETVAELEVVLALLVPDDAVTPTPVGQGLFPRCQKNIPELASQAKLTLVAAAVIGLTPVEIHLLDEADERSLWVIDPAGCDVLSVVS